MSAPAKNCVGIFGNTTKGNLLPLLDRSLQFLQERSVPFLLEEQLGTFLKQNNSWRYDQNVIRTREKVVEESDVVISLGGDGTMLAVSHLTMQFDKPLLGVNLGKLGFLAEVTADEILDALEMVISGNYAVDQRLALIGESSFDHKKITALNDIVVSKSGSARVIKMNTFVNEDFLASFHADGIIIATPTGSTAYSLATGGPIVVPSSTVLIISPISAHTLTARPVIVPDTAQIKIDASTDEGEILVMADGQMMMTSENTLTITITRSDRAVKLIKRHSSSYFDTLRSKLMWGKDTRI